MLWSLMPVAGINLNVLRLLSNIPPPISYIMFNLMIIWPGVLVWVHSRMLFLWLCQGFLSKHFKNISSSLCNHLVASVRRVGGFHFVWHFAALSGGLKPSRRLQTWNIRPRKSLFCLLSLEACSCAKTTKLSLDRFKIYCRGSHTQIHPWFLI